MFYYVLIFATRIYNKGGVAILSGSHAKLLLFLSSIFSILVFCPMFVLWVCSNWRLQLYKIHVEADSERNWNTSFTWHGFFSYKVIKIFCITWWSPIPACYDYYFSVYVMRPDCAWLFMTLSSLAPDCASVVWRICDPCQLTCWDFIVWPH